MSDAALSDLFEILLLFEDIAPELPAGEGHGETVVANVQAMFPAHGAEIVETAQRLGLWDGPSWPGDGG
jgi:hypothetical protein